MGSMNGALSAVGQSYGQESQNCCEPKADIITLLSAIGAIGAVSLFLRQAVIDYKIKGARSFRKEITQHTGTLADTIISGMFSD